MKHGWLWPPCYFIETLLSARSLPPAGVERAPNNLPLDGLAVQVRGYIMEFLLGFFDRTVEAGILRSFVGIHEISHVPRLLVAQGVALAQGHIGLDECGRGRDALHTRAPVERIVAPKGGKDHFAIDALSGAIGAMAQGTVLPEYFLAARVVGFLSRFWQPRKSLAFELDSGGRTLGKPIHIAFQGDNGFTVGRRHGPVHAVSKTALETFSQGIDMSVL